MMAFQVQVSIWKTNVDIVCLMYTGHIKNHSLSCDGAEAQTRPVVKAVIWSQATKSKYGVATQIDQGTKPGRS